MSMSESFKNHKLSDEEILWIKEIYQSKEFDSRVARVKLKDKLSKGFNPKKIDNRFVLEGKHLTALGVWLADPKSLILQHIESVIVCIRHLIIKNPGIVTITAKQVSDETGIEEPLIAIAFRNLSGLGRFFSSATGSSEEKGYSKIELSADDAYDAYLEFENLESLLERFYERQEISYERTISIGTSQYASSIYDPSLATFNFFPPVETTKYAIKRDTAFILMAMDPDNPTIEDVYRTIKEVCASYGINAYGAGEIEHQDRITDLILSEIKTCEFLIADLSYERPNVYYEIGYAHAINKRPILYRRKRTRLHFDLSVHNVPEYKNITELRELLNKRLEAILGRSKKDPG